MNSLEDAFLNITMEQESKQNAVSTEEIIRNPPASVNKKASYDFWSQLMACFTKRYLTIVRSPQGYFSIIQPLAFIITATIIPKSISDPNQSLVSFSAFLCIGFTANTSIYCGGSVYDREKKIKYSYLVYCIVKRLYRYALRVMGCKNSAYWLGTFLFDFMVICCFVGFLLVLVYTQ